MSDIKEINNNILKLSVSKCKTFESCAAKYKFTYIERLPKKDWEHLTFGKFVHRVLEDFHIEYIKGSNKPYSEIMTKAFKEALKEYRPKMTNDARREAYEIIDKYLQKISIETDLVSNVLNVEKNFNLPITDSVLLTGMIDRIQKDNDGILHICDYKTTKNKKYLKNDFLQLLTYAYAIHMEDPTIEKIRGSYILLRHNFEYITKEFVLQDILEIKNKYKNYAKMIEEEKLWSANVGPLCSFCDFNNVCLDGSKYIQSKIGIGEQNW